MKKSLFFLVLLPCLFLLSSCAAMAPKSVGLEEFVHNLSAELDCLRYCARKEGRGKGTVFFIKDPFEVELSVTSEGKITAGASPNLFTVTGLTIGQEQERAGDLRLRLSVAEFCRSLQVTFRAGSGGNGHKAPLHLADAYYFLQSSGEKEYLYIQGRDTETPGRGEAVFSRMEMEDVERIVCSVREGAAKGPPSGCLCPASPRAAGPWDE